MRVFYRDVDDNMFYGDLMVHDNHASFYDHSANMRISMLDPVIASIGVSRIHIVCEAHQYLFYTELPEWAEARYFVRSWAKSDEVVVDKE